MNAVFFLLVAILGSHAEGVKVRAIRRRIIEYPYQSPGQIIPVPTDTQYSQRSPNNEDLRIYRNGIRYNMYGSHAYGDDVNQNRRVMVNDNGPDVLRTIVAGPDSIQFGEGRSSQNEYNVDQNSRQEIKQRINDSVNQTDTNSGYKEINFNSTEQTSENEEEIGDSLGQYTLNSTDSNQMNGTVDLSEPNEADLGPVTDEIKVVTNENLANEVSENDKQINNIISLLSPLSAVPTNEVNAVDQSKLNVENVKKEPIRYVANKYYLFPPLNRRLYPVDEIKTNWENETSLSNIDYVNHIKEYNSGLIRLVPESNFISVDGDGKYLEDQSELKKDSVKNIVNVFDVINKGEIAKIRSSSENDPISPDNKNTYLFKLNNLNLKQNSPEIHEEKVDQTEVVKEENSSPDLFALNNGQIYIIGENELNLDKKAPLKNIAQVIDVVNQKNVAPIHLVATNDVISTDAQNKYPLDQESETNTINEKHDEKEERYRSPFYLYRFGPNQQQNTIIYKSTNQNIPWKQIDVSKLPQSTITQQVWEVKPNAEKNSNICLQCEALLKLLSKNPNIITQYGQLGDANDYQNNINIPTDGIPWNYLELEGKKGPTYGLQYYQPPTMITKTVNQNNLRMNTGKKLFDIIGYNKLIYPQSMSSTELTGDKLDLITPKPQVNPQYDSMKDNNKTLLTLIAAEPILRLYEPDKDASKPIGETLEAQDVSDSKEDSDEVTESLSKYPNSPIIYQTPILNTLEKVTLPVSNDLLNQNVLTKSTFYESQSNTVPNFLVQLKPPHASKIATAAVLDSEELLMPAKAVISNVPEIYDAKNIPEYHSKIPGTSSSPGTLTTNSPIPTWETVTEEEDISNTYTSIPTPWNTAPEAFLPSKVADAIDVSKTYVRFPIPQKATSQKLLTSKADQKFIIPSTVPKELVLSEAFDAKKAPTTKTPEKTTDGSDVSTYASFTTKREGILPSNAPDTIDESSYAPLTTDWITVTNELLPSETPVSKNPTTLTLATTKWAAINKSATTSPTPGESEIPARSTTPESYHWTNIPEHLLPSTVPDSSEVPTAYHSHSLPTETPEASYTSETNIPTTTDWKAVLEEKLPSREPDMFDKSVTTTTTTPGDLLHSETLGTSKIPASSTPETYHWTNIPEHLLPSTIPDSSEVSTAYHSHSLPTETPEASYTSETKIPTTTDWKAVPEEKLPSREPDMLDKSATTTTTTPGDLLHSETLGTSKISASSTPETYHWTNIPEHLLPSTEPDSSEVPTAYHSHSLPTETPEASYTSETNIPFTTDWKAVPEEKLPSREPDMFDKSATTSTTTSGDFLHSETPGTSKIPASSTPETYHWTDIPEHLLHSTEPDSSEVPTVYHFHTLPTKAPEASYTSETNIPFTTDWNALPEEKLPSREPGIFDESATATTTTPGDLLHSETPGTSKIPASSTPESYHWTNIPEHLLPSTEPDSTDVPSAYTLGPAEWRSLEVESEPAITSDEFKIPVEILYDWSTHEQFPISQHPDKYKIYTADNQTPTDWITITGESVPSSKSNEFKIPMFKIPNNRNKQEKLLDSEELVTSQDSTVYESAPTDWISITGESVPSVESDVFKIPTTKIHNDWYKPEQMLVSEELDTTKIPRPNTLVPTDWISIRGKSVPTVKTGLPDYWNKPEQLLFSEEPDTFDLPYTSIPAGWTIVNDELRPSINPDASKISTTDIREDWYQFPESWQSYTTLLNGEYDQPMLQNFEGLTQDEQNYIRQVTNILMPDLLKLYYSKCYEDVDEQLLNRLKHAINSVSKTNCETSHEN